MHVAGCLGYPHGSVKPISIALHIIIVLSAVLLLQATFCSSPPSRTPPQPEPQIPSEYMAPSSQFESRSQSFDMSPRDFEIFNRLAKQMNFYHSMLRKTWDELYAGTAQGARQPTTSSLISLGLHFCDHLKAHHDIEETYWFPVLGKKMEAFRGSGFAKEQHRAIHKGLDVLAPYLRDCKKRERELRRQEVREIMDSFGGILWAHLDDEVRELGAENMSKYWSKDEMRKFPF